MIKTMAISLAVSLIAIGSGHATNPDCNEESQSSTGIEREVLDLSKPVNQVPVYSNSSCLNPTHIEFNNNGLPKTTISREDLLTKLLSERNISGKSKEILDQLVASAKKATSIEEIKNLYEKTWEELSNHSIVYNKSSTRVNESLETGKMQCASGTLIFALIAAKIAESKPDFIKNAVVIFENGHVLPGFLKGTGNSTELVGIETTAAGSALKEYGSLSDTINNITWNLTRVISLEDYLLSEALKNQTPSPSKMGLALIKNFVQKNKLKLNTDDLPPIGNVDSIERRCSSEPSWSPLAFGEASVPEGDLKRGEVNNRLLNIQKEVVRFYQRVEQQYGNNYPQVERWSAFEAIQKQANDLKNDKKAKKLSDSFKSAINSISPGSKLIVYPASFMSNNFRLFQIKKKDDGSLGLFNLIQTTTSEFRWQEEVPSKEGHYKSTTFGYFSIYNLTTNQSKTFFYDPYGFGFIGLRYGIDLEVKDKNDLTALKNAVK